MKKVIKLKFNIIQRDSVYKCLVLNLCLIKIEEVFKNNLFRWGQKVT